MAMRAFREKAGTGTVAGTVPSQCASDSDGEDEILMVPSEDDEPSLRDDGTRTGPQPRSKPIYDPLCGQTAGALAAIQPRSIFDFFVRDICSAYPFLGLANKIEDVTEDMDVSAELFLGFCSK